MISMLKFNITLTLLQENKSGMVAVVFMTPIYYFLAINNPF